MNLASLVDYHIMLLIYYYCDVIMFSVYGKINMTMIHFELK